MNWQPHNLIHCLDSATLGYLTASLAVGMLVWYLLIAKRWWCALQHAPVSGRRVWGWLIAIFIICAMAGYVSLVVSLVLPKIAVWWRIAFLLVRGAQIQLSPAREVSSDR